MPEIAGVSAGGMPTRVKCLHVLAAQALAQGGGVNPLGDEVVDALGDFWAGRPLRGPVTRVGAIDCGTNTIKLLVADLDAATGEEEQLVREMRIVRLGQDVDRTGRLADDAVARTLAAVEEYAAILQSHHVDVLRFCATSASRDAEQRGAFRAAVRDLLGIEPEVVSGDEEAALAYDGATRSLRSRDDLARPFLVVDLGGGSTEAGARPGAGDRRSRGRPVARHRVGASDRAVAALGPTHRGGGGGGDGCRRRGPRHPPRARRRPGHGGHRRGRGRHRHDGRDLARRTRPLGPHGDPSCDASPSPTSMR